MGRPFLRFKLDMDNKYTLSYDGPKSDRSRLAWPLQLQRLTGQAPPAASKSTHMGTNMYTCLPLLILLYFLHTCHHCVYFQFSLPMSLGKLLFRSIICYQTNLTHLSTCLYLFPFEIIKPLRCVTERILS